ncbi:sigma-70 family RNA polymerase sigma factor [Streptomyces sp. NPDC003717]|uniref:sigma-70 family RNA polymerase sigma factor n=1 Tax=Streptomyces sp. NPDC003717 TaxID=3154276 RepID=UPI00339ED35E
MAPGLIAALRPVLAAESAAEAAACGADPRDLEQAVWLRLLERLGAQGPPPDPHRWLRGAVRAEARRVRRRDRAERPWRHEPADDAEREPEALALTAVRRRALRDAARRLPGRCPRLLAALLSAEDLTYREIAGELGISQGSLGPERARCLACLGRLLTAEVAARRGRG